jgi:hypothetical protein
MGVSDPRIKLEKSCFKICFIIFPVMNFLCIFICVIFMEAINPKFLPTIIDWGFRGGLC